MTEILQACLLALVLLQTACSGKSSSATSNAARLASEEDAFIALERDGSIAVHEYGGEIVRTMDKGPFSDATIDPELGLIWARSVGCLKVLDLREQRGVARSIACGIPIDAAWSVEGPDDREDRLVEPPNTCEHEREVRLNWSGRIGLVGTDSSDSGATQLSLPGAPWLARQSSRARLTEPARIEFTDPDRPRIAIAADLVDCDDVEECGRYVPYGDAGLRLVMVRSRVGADCMHYSCVVEDPASQQFATPPALENWGRPERTASGPCGPYRFDRNSHKVLLGNFLCAAAGGCTRLGGPSLGWVLPGPIVGTDG